jgi:hypothetical protein
MIQNTPIGDDFGETKIGDLDVTALIDHQILRLEIAIDDVLGVHVLEAQH